MGVLSFFFHCNNITFLMPKYENVKHTFEHSWNDISLASWKKYPTETRPDVLSVDLVERNFDPETGILTATRVVIMEDKLPRFLQPIFGNNKCISIEETCTYTQNESNPEWTDFKQEAAVHAYPFGVSNNIEKFMTSKFVRNAPLGREIMENTVKSVKEENIMRKAFAALVQETRDCAEAFEKRFDR